MISSKDIHFGVLWFQGIIGTFTRHKLFQNTFIYTLAQILNSAVPFFLLPVMTRYLSPSDYGIVSTFAAFVGMLNVFVGLSLHGAVNVNFFQINRSELEGYIFNVMLILCASSLLVFLIILFCQDLISQRLTLPREWIPVGVCFSLANSITLVNLVLWQAEQRAKAYALYTFSNMLVNITFSLILVVGLGMGWSGRLLGMAGATFIYGFLSIFFIVRRGYIKFKFDAGHIKDALLFGLPLVPHDLAIWFMTAIDRFFINSIVGVQDTGLYSVGYQVGLIIGIIATAFNQAWGPFLYKKLGDIDTLEKIRLVKFTYLFFIVLGIMAILLSLFSNLSLQIFLGDTFERSKNFVLWIALAYAFNGMYFMVCHYILYTKNNFPLACVTFFVSLLHVGLSYTLIKNYGAIGAAKATTISFFVRFIMVWVVSSRVYPMPWKKSATQIFLQLRGLGSLRRMG
jgi:O-antigen/teichoic acid export membrane protein